MRDEQANSLLLTLLLVNCPFNAPVPHCPLSEARKKPIHDRIHWITQLDEEQANKILLYHKQCTAERTKPGVTA